MDPPDVSSPAGKSRIRQLTRELHEVQHAAEECNNRSKRALALRADEIDVLRTELQVSEDKTEAAKTHFARQLVALHEQQEESAAQRQETAARQHAFEQECEAKAEALIQRNKRAHVELVSTREAAEQAAASASRIGDPNAEQVRASAELAKYQEELSAMMQEISSLKDLEKKLKADHPKAQRTVHDREDEVIDFECELRGERDLHEQARERLAEEEAVVASRERSLDEDAVHHSQELADLDSRLEEAIQDSTVMQEKLTMEMRLLKGVNQAQDGELQRLKVERDVLAQESKAMLHDKEERFGGAVHDLQSEQQKVLHQYNAVCVELADYRLRAVAQLGELREMIALYEQESSGKAIAASTGANLRAVITTLQDQVAEEEGNLASVLDALKAAEATVANSGREEQEMRSEHEQALDDLDQARQRCLDKSSELKAVQDASAAATRDSATAQRRLEQDDKKLESDLLRSRRVLQEELELVHAEVQRLRTLRDQLQRDNSVERESLDLRRVKLEQRIQELRARDLDTKLEELRDANRDLQVQAAQKSRAVQEVDRQRAAKEEEVLNNLKINDGFTQTIERLTEALHLLRSPSDFRQAQVRA
mmetsp:Transcript_56977/g.152185  ORF Transcript_56977/g.152185 Transcript_56977/m.152185 type:complete len:598 (+) Transcript_56977:36-1829(+)